MNRNEILRTLMGNVAKNFAPPVGDFELNEKQPRRLEIEALEPRILFSVAPAPAPAPEPAPVAEEAPAPAPTETVTPTSEVGTAAVIAVPPAASEPHAETAAAADQGVTGVTLTGAEVEAVAAAAAQRWVESGISEEQAAALNAISYEVADLGGNHLGVANGSAITIDDDAAGTGSWFIDTTPDNDDEFASGAAVGGFDLLSVILHEQGHVLGLADSRGSGGLMDSVLGEGSRRLPAAGQADGAVPGSNDNASYISAPNFNALTFDFDTFTGTGFDPAPAAGQLDSNDWSVTGFSQAPGSVPFGGSESTGDFARGASTGGVSTGGVYSFDIGAGDNVLGVQPAGSDFTPGTITLQIQNNTGGTVSEWDVSYDIAVLNDQARANSFDLQVAIGTMDTPGVFVPVSGFEFTTPEAADGAPAWVSTAMAGTVNATVTDGSYLFLRWFSDDVSGAGSRDEIGLNNLSVQAVQPPAAPTVVISEIMYDPNSGEPDWEWVEVANTGTELLDLSGWVIDDINGISHGSANIASGVIAAGGTAVLFNVDDISAADFEAAWGPGINLVPVTNWSAMGLNNSGGDTVGIWNSFASYSGDHSTHANAIVSVAYPDLGVGASVFLPDLADQSTFALSADGTPTPAGGAAYLSLAAGGNVGGEAGSPLEPVAFDTGISIDGSLTLIIEDVEAPNDDDLTIWSDGTYLNVRDSSNVLGHSIVGAMIKGPGIVMIPLGLFEDISIQTNDGADIVSVTDLTGFDQSLTIDGGGTDGAVDVIDFRASILGASGESYDFDAENIQFGVDSSIAATGAGTIDIDGTGGGADKFQGVKLRRASLSTEDGAITIDGEGGSVGRQSDGVLITTGSSVSTTGGSITITGTAGGTTGANDGVSVLGSSDISTTGTGGITITGTSSGTTDSAGVQLFTGTEVTTVDGDIAIAGSGTGTGARNTGIYTNKATVTTTGTGSISLDGTGNGVGNNSKGLRLSGSDIVAVGSGAITLAGTAGGSTNANQGVQIGVATSVTTASGDVEITGVGAGGGNGNSGVSFGSKSSVSSGGGLTITGTSGVGGHNNDGVNLSGATVAAIGSGDITITGTGYGTGNSNNGVKSTRSTISGAANVTIAGTGSTGSSGSTNDGVYLKTSTVSSVGTTTMTGSSGTGTKNNRGIIATASTITAGTTFDIDGTANPGTTATGNVGVSIAYSTLSSAGTIDGTGGGAGNWNYGVRMEDIITGLPEASVTGTATIPADNTHGDYFSILPILPMLMAEADRRQRRGGKADREGDGQNGALGALFSRMGEVGLLDFGSPETPVFRILHGQVDPITVNGSDADLELTLEAAGIEIPNSPVGTRRILILTGEDGGPLSGFFAYLLEGGEFESSAPLEGSEDMTVGEFLDRANQTGSARLRWSSEAMGSRDSTLAIASYSDWQASGSE